MMAALANRVWNVKLVAQKLKEKMENQHAANLYFFSAQNIHFLLSPHSVIF
jgi:hypothetical protein